jgi:hypothetical protein
MEKQAVNGGEAARRNDQFVEIAPCVSSDSPPQTEVFTALHNRGYQ